MHHVIEICDENVIVGGDFNITLNSELDKKGGNCEQHSAYRENLKGFMDTYDMENHDVSLFTYFSIKPIILSRIDFWLVPSFLSPFIKSDIKHSIKSDHSVILLNINSALHANRGPGFWKFIASLLEDI